MTIAGVEDEMASFPPNNMAIVAIHRRTNVQLFEKSVSCDAEALTAEDQALSNNDILLLDRSGVRDLCKKCKYKQLKNNGELQTKTISMSGPDADVKGRVLAYFHVLRQQNSLGANGARQYSLNVNQGVLPRMHCLLEI